MSEQKPVESYDEERERRQREYDEKMEKRLVGHTSDRLSVQVGGEGRGGQWWSMLHGTRRRVPSVPRIVAEAAWEGYAADGHGEQSCERLHERGGFSLSELGYYLARAVDEGRIRIEIVASSSTRKEPTT